MGSVVAQLSARLLGAGLLVTVAACGSGGTSVTAEDATTSTSTPTSTPTTAAPASSPRTALPGLPRATLTPPPVKSGPLLTLTGTVEDGVEARCRVLRTERGVFQLLGLGTRVPAGVVTVTGRERFGIATTCQQGRPLQVESIEPSSSSD